MGADPALVASQSSHVSLSRPSGFDPGEGSLHYRTSWPRPATPCEMVPLWKGEFRDFDDWVNFATTRLTGTTNDYGIEVAAICVDALGRRCSMGGDFMRARDEGAFPVHYFWECVPLARIEARSDATPKSDAAEGESRNSSPTCRENGNG